MAGDEGFVILASSPAHDGLFALDPTTGGAVSAYSNNACRTGGVAVIGGRASDGAPANGYVVAAQANAPALHVWTWPTGRAAPYLRCATQERMATVAATPDGAYLAAGAAASGKVYLWCVATGELLRVFDAHYRAITALCFTDDGALLLSAGADAVAHAWSLGDLIDCDGDGGAAGGAAAAPPPACSWCEHTLPITAMACGIGGASARVYTVSMDRSCRVWEVGARASLHAIELPCAATAVAVDSVESRVFVGGADGRIFCTDVCAAAAAASAMAVGRLQAGAGADAGGAFALGDGPGGGVDGDDMSRKRLRSAQSAGGAEGAEGSLAFVGHRAAVCALRVTASGGRLVSAARDGDVRVWDVRSRQTTRELAPGAGGGGAGEGGGGRGGGVDTALILAPCPPGERGRRLSRLRPRVPLQVFSKYPSVGAQDGGAAAGAGSGVVVWAALAEAGGADVDGSMAPRPQPRASIDRLVDEERHDRVFDRGILDDVRAVAADGERPAKVLRRVGAGTHDAPPPPPDGAGSAAARAEAGAAPAPAEAAGALLAAQGEIKRLQELNARWQKVNTDLHRRLSAPANRR
eukprot:g6955.t1